MPTSLGFDSFIDYGDCHLVRVFILISELSVNS